MHWGCICLDLAGSCAGRPLPALVGAVVSRARVGGPSDGRAWRGLGVKHRSVAYVRLGAGCDRNTR